MPKKILLADDSITIQKVVELTFSDGDYEVTAVNNGAKAVQKLAEMRPDIILSDIIMPEKNGYEVCEYVKSNPEYRNIPVVLLTGTFEPFDPDRAEKAGCDAVVTKPFESQSLIHKVEELIAQSQQSAAAAAAAPAPAESPSPWMDDSGTSAPEASSAFTTASGGFPTAPPADDAFTHDADIFGAAPAPEATTEMPFEAPAESPFGAPPPAEEFSGETRAFPRMSFEDMQRMAAPEPPAAAPAPEPSPWDAPAAEAFSGETRAFEKMSFDDFAAPAPTPAPEPEPAPQAEPESPFGAPPPAEEFSGETRAFPRLSFEELQQQMATPAPAPTPAPEPEAAPEPSPWGEPAAASPFGGEETPAFGGETRAFPKMNFDDLQALSSAPPSPEQPLEPAPWGEPADSQFNAPAPTSPFEAGEEAPAFGGETRAFPKLSFDDFNQMSAPAPEPEPEPEPQSEPHMAWEAPSPEAVPWSPTADSSFDTPATESFSTAGAAPFTDEPPVEAMPEDLPFATETTPEPEPIPAEEPSWSPMATAEAQAEPDEPVVPPPALAPEAPAMPIAASGSLTDEQVDRIARRVVELMSDQVVRNIAWEVIPDLAEMVVKERIRQLEAEA